MAKYKPYRYEDQSTPPAQPAGGEMVTRVDGVLEIDPALMRNVHQPTLAAWDFERIVDNRAELIEWMHDHWAHETISAQELLDEIADEVAGS